MWGTSTLMSFLTLINPLDLDEGLPHDFRLVAQDRQIGTEIRTTDRSAPPDRTSWIRSSGRFPRRGTGPG